MEDVINEEETICVMKMRLSKLRNPKYFSKQEVKSLIGTEFWTAKRDHHIKITGVEKDHNGNTKILIKDYHEGKIIDSRLAEERWKNPTFWDHKILEWENGVPVTVDESNSTEED